MQTVKVTSTRKINDSSIELTIADPLEDTPIIRRYASIRGGISWATAKSPAYLCIIGQEYVKPRYEVDPEQNGLRVILAEHEHDSLSLQRFYNYLTDLAEQFMCDFYVDMPVDRNDCGFLNDYDDHATVRKSKSYLFEAHDVDNFLLGVARIRDNYDSGTLIIPDDSIVFEQLRTIAKIDLEDSPEERFFAINALRHAIGSFHRHPVKLYKHKPQNRPTTWRVM